MPTRQTEGERSRTQKKREEKGGTYRSSSCCCLWSLAWTSRCLWSLAWTSRAGGQTGAPSWEMCVCDSREQRRWEGGVLFVRAWKGSSSQSSPPNTPPTSNQRAGATHTHTHVNALSHTLTRMCMLSHTHTLTHVFMLSHTHSVKSTRSNECTFPIHT